MVDRARGGNGYQLKNRSKVMEVITIDLRFRNIAQAIAAYVIVGPGGPVLIETGPGSTVERMQAGLGEHGISAADIRHVFVTHIHLDHAGAAGWWAEQGAQIYVHWKGARHLIYPSRLLGSARRIYGDAMDALWGPIMPVPAKQLHELRDDDVVNVNGLEISALDTPGHAYHHHTLRIGNVAFCGDAAGARIPGAQFITLLAPPPEFDLEGWQLSLARLLGLNLARIYLTHFGCVRDVREHLEVLVSHLNQATEFVRMRMCAGAERCEIIKDFVRWNRERALENGVCSEQFVWFEKANPLDMSVDGIMRYWRKKWENEES